MLRWPKRFVHHLLGGCKRDRRISQVGGIRSQSCCMLLHVVSRGLLSKHFAINRWDFCTQWELGQLLRWIVNWVCYLWRHEKQSTDSNEIWQPLKWQRKNTPTWPLSRPYFAGESHWMRVDKKPHSWQILTSRAHGLIAAVAIWYSGRWSAGEHTSYQAAISKADFTGMLRRTMRSG